MILPGGLPRLAGIWGAFAGLLLCCGQKVVNNPVPPGPVITPVATSSATGMVSDTAFLPENLIARDAASDITARYTDPTTRYTHGILGDGIEGGGLLVVKAGKRYYYKLDERFVFEDLQPRIADVDKDGQPEFVTIRTSLMQGAGVAVFKLVNDQLILLATSEFIGTPNRWLNIAAIADLDNDGKVEVTWVQTPHIGGILRVANLVNDRLQIIDEKSGYSNHQIGQRNLCLSALTASTPLKTLYLPTNDYTTVAGLQLVNGKLTEQSRLSKTIDPAKPLNEQVTLSSLITDSNCIHVP